LLDDGLERFYLFATDEKDFRCAHVSSLSAQGPAIPIQTPSLPLCNDMGSSEAEYQDKVKVIRKSFATYQGAPLPIVPNHLNSVQRLPEERHCFL